jgi:TolB-like protein
MPSNHFCNKIGHERTHALQKRVAEALPFIPGSFVIARDTAFTYKGKPTLITGHIVETVEAVAAVAHHLA